MMHTFIIFLVLTCTTTATITTTATATITTTHNRRTLHRPFFPDDNPVLPPAQPPTTLPPSLNIPFLSTPTTPPPSDDEPFFPSVRPPPSPPPPPPAPQSSTASFPANISALNLPTTQNPKHVSSKLIPIAIALAIVSVVILSIFIIFKVIKRRRYNGESQSVTEEKPHRAYNNSVFNAPVNKDGNNYNRIPKLNRPSQTSSEFLYLGTLVNSHSGVQANGTRGNENNGDEALHLQKVGSPELRPLPPLTGGGGGRSQTFLQHDGFENSEYEEFYSPAKSVAVDGDGTGVDKAERSSSSSYSLTSSGSPARSISLSISPPVSLSPRNMRMKSPELVAIKTAPPPSRPAPPPPPPPPPLPPHVGLSKDSLESSPRLSNSSNDLSFSPVRIPPPSTKQPYIRPPSPVTRLNPPVLVKPARPVSSVTEMLPRNQANLGTEEETRKPKLKPLHWDKVRASSDHEMAWDHLKSSSFKLNEERIETLFVVKPSNATNFNEKTTIKHPVFPTPISHESQVLDPKKSQNIAIALRALNVTSEEVCEALLEGNADRLGIALLEILLKMAPTKEEERKLKEYRDDSPSKLGPAEKFIKAVLDVPFAFMRVGAMLYVSNFDSEVKYLKLSFQILEAACEELKNNRMFLKLLEAVLKTGNRMNIGTNRGDAQAFNLDTLLKLVDVKSADGKTTLLHFVIQEIIRTEGARNLNPATNQTAKPLVGLQTVSSIGSDLSNVKKAAAMDSEVLNGDVTRLSNGIKSIIDVVKLMESTKFSDSMNRFLKMAQEEVIKIQVQESETLSLVKEITEYFHGNSSAKEDTHPLRIFVVVRDFLTVLDRVCKEVGTLNDRVRVNSVQSFSGPTPVINGFQGRQQYSSSDDESSSSL